MPVTSSPLRGTTVMNTLLELCSLIPKTETYTEHYEYLGDIEYEEISYPYLLPGTIAWIGGIYLWYKGMLMKLKPVAPYQTAADIAEEYNKGIIAEITK